MKQSESSQRSKESKYFDELRNENYDNSFPVTEAWLRTANENPLNNKKTERNIIMKLKNYFTSHKFRLAYAFLILAFVVAACNYPVTQQESAGDIMKWSVSKDNTEAVARIESMDWFKSGEFNINEENVNGKNVVSYSLVLSKENHANIQDYKSQLERINGVNDIKIIPLNEIVKRPVYSVLLNDLFKIDINATNMSDAELEKEITSQLKNAGIEAVTVDFKGDENGHRMVKVVIPDDQIKKEGGFDMTIKDGNNVTKMKEIRKTAPDNGERFKGKTDEEIKKMIREDIGNPDIKDDEIEIIRDGDKVKVKVNVKKNGIGEEKRMEIK